MLFHELPSPIVFKGVAAKDMPLLQYLILYLDLSFDGVVIFSFLLANESFFMMCIIILGNRFAAIRDILGLLNYEGVRNRSRDFRIIRDCYFLHLEVLE